MSGERNVVTDVFFFSDKSHRSLCGVWITTTGSGESAATCAACLRLRAKMPRGGR